MLVLHSLGVFPEMTRAEILGAFKSHLSCMSELSLDLAAAQLLSLTHACCTGLEEAADDPFGTGPRASNALNVRVTNLDASQHVSAASWAVAFEEGRYAGDKFALSRDKLAAMALWVERYMLEEAEICSISIAITGVEEKQADLAGAQTAICSAAIMVGGDPLEWARHLALANQMNLRTMKGDSLNGRKIIQATALRRGINTQNIDDLEEILEEITATRTGLAAILEIEKEYPLQM